MLKKTRNIALIAGALAAISFGGSALAAAGAAPVTPIKATVAPVTQKADGETNEGATQKAADAETNDGVQGAADTETADAGQEAGDAETNDGGQEGADTETNDSGSEVPGKYGPGGHADEPGNPNAQNQE